jgi:hypothetical protein
MIETAGAHSRGQLLLVACEAPPPEGRPASGRRSANVAGSATAAGDGQLARQSVIGTAGCSCQLHCLLLSVPAFHTSLVKSLNPAAAAAAAALMLLLRCCGWKLIENPVPTWGSAACALVWLRLT